MKTVIHFASISLLALAITDAAAQEPTAEQLEQLAAKGFESDPNVLKEVATGAAWLVAWRQARGSRAGPSHSCRRQE